MRTTSSYRRSWPGRRLAKAALETPEPAMRQKLCGRTSRRRLVLPHRSRVPCRPPALSTVGAGQGARRPGRWCGHGHQASRLKGKVRKVPVWSDGSTTLSNMCSCAGSGAVGSAGAGGAVDAGCLDPMLDRLLAVEVAGLPDSALAADLVGLRVTVSRLESEFARRLVVFDRRAAAGGPGAVSTAAWLRQACRLSAGEASERVRTARVLADDLAVSADALAGGIISYAHARLLASAAGELTAESLPTVEPILVEAARHTDPAGPRALCTQVRTMLDPTGAEEAAALAHDRRHLSISATFAGTVVLDGVLDPEAGATALAALAPLAAPGGADDDRTPAQRRADALVELARRALDGAGLPSVGGERPHIQIRVDYATLLARTGTATLDWAGPLSAGAALRLACDATISPVLTAGPSEVLDLGRSVRLVSPAQRRALVVRDGGCVWPDCDRPPAFTDAHHLRHWVDGGATDLANLALVCRRHHRLVHAGWTLTHRPDGIWSATPPSTQC